MANITERTLCSPANPLVSISYISNTAVQGRGVGFISASFKGDKRLVTTCRHNFEQATSPDLRLVFMTASMTASGPHLSRELKMIGQPIFDPRPNSDIAFVVVSDPSNSNTHPLKLQPSDLDISPERPVLLNAQNISYEDQHRLCDFAVTRQEPVKKLGDRFYIQRSDGGFTVLAEDKSKHETEQMSARKCFYLSMISRRGFSGSPIWTEKFKLYGMDISGSDGEEGNDDVTVCIPRSELHEAKQLVDDQIQETLAL